MTVVENILKFVQCTANFEVYIQDRQLGNSFGTEGDHWLCFVGHY